MWFFHLTLIAVHSLLPLLVYLLPTQYFTCLFLTTYLLTTYICDKMFKSMTLRLTKGGDVEGCVPLLGGSINVGTALQQLPHHIDVAFLAGQVQRVQPILQDTDTFKINSFYRTQTQSICRTQTQSFHRTRAHSRLINSAGHKPSHSTGHGHSQDKFIPTPNTKENKQERLGYSFGSRHPQGRQYYSSLSYSLLYRSCHYESVETQAVSSIINLYTMIFLYIFFSGSFPPRSCCITSTISMIIYAIVYIVLC